MRSEKPHRKLKVWQESMDFVIDLYRILEGFPREERFGLVTQLQRAVVSIPSNLAEGAARKSKKEFLQFLYIARGSLSELDTQLEIALRLSYMDEGGFMRLMEKLSGMSMMLNGLINSLEKNG